MNTHIRQDDACCKNFSVYWNQQVPANTPPTSIQTIYEQTLPYQAQGLFSYPSTSIRVTDLANPPRLSHSRSHNIDITIPKHSSSSSTFMKVQDKGSSCTVVLGSSHEILKDYCSIFLISRCYCMWHNCGRRASCRRSLLVVFPPLNSTMTRRTWQTL